MARAGDDPVRDVSVAVTEPLRAIIADDEPLARQALRRFVAADGTVDVVAEASDVPSLRHVLREHSVDVLFLDVTMPGGSGLDAVTEIPPGTAVVFTTAHAEHAVTAFTIDAADYLLKPFGQDRVHEALVRVRRWRQGRLEAQGAPVSAPEYLQLFMLRVGTRVHPVPVRDVWRLEGSDDFVRVVTATRAVLHGSTLAAVEARLDPAFFVRVHRSHIVNLAWVTRLVAIDERRLAAEFPDGSQIPCSRTGSVALRRRTRQTVR